MMKPGRMLRLLFITEDENMGQYFKIANLDRFERIESDSFRKLMEFCYIGNSAPDEAMRLLLPGNQWHNTRVTFVGDYCDDDDREAELRKSALENLPEQYRSILKKGDDDRSLYGIFSIFPERQHYGGKSPRYLFNHNQKQYVDLKDCPEYNGGYKIHPLGLLTALGNGNGGGDYYSDNGAEYVGSWCGDTLSSDFKLTFAEYERITSNFTEEKGQ